MFKVSLVFMRPHFKQTDKPIAILILEFVKKDLACLFAYFRGWEMNPELHICY